MKRFHWAKLVILFIVIGPIAIFIFGWIVMFLWNNALAPVLHISEVTFWQGLGILVLCKILFSSFSGGRSRRHSTWKERITQKWNNMTPEEKEKFKQKWEDRWWKGGFKPWDSESGAGQMNPGS
jgi:hypothetical protein